MHERPIADLVDALRLLGADIRYLANNGYPPIHISGKAIEGGHTVISGNVSSQFLTAVLLAAPLAAGDVTIDVTGELVSKPYIDMTIETMARFGVSVVREGYRRFLVPAAARYISPGTYAVEPDASSATYFLAAGAIAGEVTVEGLGSKCIQGDAAFAQVLHAMGADVEIAETHTTVRSCPLTAIDMDLNHIPDAAMTAAVAALFARGTTRIRNIYNWRVKETDRLDAMDRELSKLGATVRTTRDSIEITPPTKFLPAVIDTYDDHRMAMSLALAAFGVGLTINDPQCTDKTFPQFFDRFNAICS
jgi:3-phosphoshikimate 1-carboxyvinyltransferase